MNWIYFFILIVIFIFFYLRISKRINHLNLEISDDLKNEILSLIATFNQSAEQNIALIEERVSLAKAISKEIAGQLDYMKKLKETLEKEIRESEIKLNTIIVNQKALVDENFKKNNQIHETYKKVEAKIKEQMVLLNENEEKLKSIPLEKKEEKIDEEVVFIPEVSEQEKEEGESEKESAPSIQEQIDILSQSGMNLTEIAKQLKMSQGEIELILKFRKNL